MTTTHCPSCYAPVAATDVNCPGCGVQVRGSSRNFRKWLIIGVIVVVLGGLLLLGILLAFLLPSIGDGIEQAKRSGARADMQLIRSALNEYALHNGARYPDALAALVLRDERGAAYLQGDGALLDPWEQMYEYAPPTAAGEPPVLYSCGPDRLPGTEDDVHPAR